MTGHSRASHPDIVKRLKRAEGPLRSVISMIETGKPCLDIEQSIDDFKAITKYL